ncbi:restriction endonuclease subunit S [Capnocytophaga genosp. AHN8471]|uniref:restriction endonuclease subunit S n=1 Tax=Capnocytophaga genosp. AHN8471 TaxID=327574 RepID=UPI001932D916|nr:restriction endonuclease subunit S [Capnocytophaga genosp. AHN8471]MBM0656708.1 restriction endonuclease subunit S [Capnocytophaga genosp. AHN8471]
MTQEPKIFPYIERLLQGAEVVWKPLGEVLKRTKGTKITAGQMKAIHKDKAPVKIFAGGKTFAFVDFEDIPEKDINQKPSIIVKSRGIIEFEYYDKPFSHKNEMWSYYSENENINIKYVYYFLKQQEPYFQKLGSKMQMPQIALPDTEKFQIPLPPLSVQQEIVRILDKFTQLEAELEAELDCRKRQYEYYRNKLLTFNEIGGGTKIVWKTLGEVSKKISSGGTPKTTVSEYYNGEIPWLRTQEVGYGEIWDTSIKITEEAIKNSSAKWIPKDCVIIAMYGATVGRVGINKIPLTTNQACANIEVNEEIANYKYIYYYLLNQYEYIKSLGAGSQTNINAQIVKSLKIPLPPLEEQQRIANILDKFDTLVNSISEGLPKEIALCRKQYEYYREKLLSFPS